MALTEQQLRTRVQKLPPEVREVYGSVDTVKKIEAITQEHGLNPAQEAHLSNEIGYVLIGKTHPKDFIAVIRERLNIDKQKAMRVAESVNEALFKAVRDHLQVMYQGGGAADDTDTGEPDQAGPSLSYTPESEMPEVQGVGIDTPPAPDHPPVQRNEETEDTTPQKQDVYREPIEEEGGGRETTKPSLLEKKTKDTLHTKHTTVDVDDEGESDTKNRAQESGDPYREPIE